MLGLYLDAIDESLTPTSTPLERPFYTAQRLVRESSASTEFNLPILRCPHACPDADTRVVPQPTSRMCGVTCPLPTQRQ
jgi:hypothetical protein